MQVVGSEWSGEERWFGKLRNGACPVMITIQDRRCRGYPKSRPRPIFQQLFERPHKTSNPQGDGSGFIIAGHIFLEERLLNPPSLHQPNWSQAAEAKTCIGRLELEGEYERWQTQRLP